ncbi:MAG TPA: hypothetical protein VLT61_01120 [Anaeromyxobacteraceae bacterium]|nr:hypothetical protein [Anaeromyxobacteraceae bacterium]
MLLVSKAIVPLLVLALAAPAAATPRLAVAPVRGEGGRALDAQLERALCSPDRCIPRTRLGPRPGLARARRAGADGVLLGSVWRERGGRVLSLALFTVGARPARTWVLPLGSDGRVAPDRLVSLAREMDEALGVPRPAVGASPPAPIEAPIEAPAAPRSDLTLAPPVAPPALPREPVEAPRAAPPVLESEPAVAGGPIAAELGVEAARRSLRFPSGGTSPVGYSVTLPAVPRLALEFRPLRLAGARLAGLALFAEGGGLPGIRVPSGERTHEATFLAVRAGLRWRLPAADRLVLVPTLAWERTSFVVAPAGGTRVPGLPDDRRAGPSAALGVEVPLAGPPERPRLALLGAVRAAWWLEAGELAGGAAFFPGGRAWTLGAEAGAALRIGRVGSLRCSAVWDTTRWSLDGDPSGAYSVASARAEVLGARVSVRLGP